MNNYDMNQQIQSKFIRDYPKPYSRPKTYLLPSYSEFETPKSKKVHLQTPLHSEPPESSSTQDMVIEPEDNPSYTVNQTTTPNVNQIHCQSIHAHIQGCPVCSKIYKSNNNTFYLIICVLILLLLFLLKYILPI